MPSFKHLAVALMIDAVATVSADPAPLMLQDTAGAGGCTGGGACCEPSCTIQVNGVRGCSGTVMFSESCKMRYDQNPLQKANLDVGGCDKTTATWFQDETGKKVIDIQNQNEHKYDRFEITSCELATVGGGQCAPSGGGCTVNRILEGAPAQD